MVNKVVSVKARIFQRLGWSKKKPATSVTRKFSVEIHWVISFPSSDKAYTLKIPEVTILSRSQILSDRVKYSFFWSVSSRK